MFTRTNLRQLGLNDHRCNFYLDKRYYNSILNLSHLDANENMSKNNKALLDWVKAEAHRQNVTPNKFCADRLLPNGNLDIDLNFLYFDKFIDSRRKILSDHLQNLLT